MGIVDKINYLKARDNMTSDEVAQRSGVPIGTLNKILSGETQNPTGKTASKIARVFGETAEYLLNDDIAITADSADRFTQASDTETDFYKILSSIMERGGLTIPEVARKCGLSDSTVRSIFDRKQKKIALNVAFKVADGLGVSLEELNGELNSNTNIDDAPKLKVVDPSDPQKDALNRNYDALNTEGRKKLVDYSDDLVSSGRYKLTDID